MGSQIKAICKCGYNKTSLIGGGKLNYKTTEYFPCLCGNCNEIVQSNLRKEKLICPNCSSFKISPYNTKKLIGTIGENIIERSFDNILTDGFYKCPKCKEMLLQFFREGIIWD